MTFWLLIRQRRCRSAHETGKEIIKQQADNACSKVPWSKGQDTGLSSRRYWVQGLRSASVGAKRGPLDHSTPWGSLWLLSLKVRTPASQAGDDGFEVYASLRSVLDVVHWTTAPRRSYCGYRTMVVRQIVALLMGAQDVRGTSALRRPKRSGDRFPLVTPWMGMPSGEGSGL